jgi:DNA repair exonuclease SbcCD ATPase subunit
MKEINFKRIAIQNFLSVGEDPVVVEFNKGLHVITGLNRDKPDRRNAIGKSTIADAIYFAVFGDTLRELKKDLIANNITGSSAHVELDFEVKTTKGVDEYKVIRTLPPTKAFVYKNGVDKTRDSVSNTTRYICDVTCATPAIFKNCVIMTINDTIPFMAKSKVEKRKFIEDIFGLEVFSDMLSMLRGEYNEIKREYDIEAAKLDEISKTCDSYRVQKDSIIARRAEKKRLYLERESSNARELEELAKSLATSDEIDINTINAQLNKLGEKIKICDKKIDESIENISTKKANVKHIKEKYNRIGTSEEKCPVCLRSIEDHDVDYIEEEKRNLKDQISSIVEELKIVGDALDRARTAKQTISSAIDQYNNKLSDAKLAIQRKENTIQRIEQLKKWQEELQVDLAAVDSSETDIDKLLEESCSRLSEIEKKIKEHRTNISRLDIVKYVLSEEGVKSYIVKKLLELLNSKMLTYLRKLDSNSICIFNEFFEEEILNEKNKVCSYFNFSGAERKAIDLACLFTFSDIRRMQGGVKYNVAIYDELFDSSFDEKGIELVTQILHDRVEELDECAIVISHRKESIKAVTGEVVYLEKENGITRRVDYGEI